MIYLKQLFEVPQFIDESELNESTNSITPLSTWTTVNRVKTLSRTDDHTGIEEFRLRKSVAAGYQFEYQYLPGGPDPTRNWKFTDCDNGAVVHLNEGTYKIKSVSSSARVTSDTNIRQEFSGVVNVGIYTVVLGQTIRISIADNDFSGTINYSISLVQ